MFLAKDSSRLGLEESNMICSRIRHTIVSWTYPPTSATMWSSYTRWFPGLYYRSAPPFWNGRCCVAICAFGIQTRASTLPVWNTNSTVLHINFNANKRSVWAGGYIPTNHMTELWIYPTNDWSEVGDICDLRLGLAFCHRMQADNHSTPLHSTIQL